MDAIGRNHEWYSDPTAGEAIRKTTKFGYRPVVYICSKYRGDVDKNTYRARLYSRLAVDMGYIPLAPHLLLPQYISEHTERDLALFMGLVLLKKCEEIWVCGREISEGMQMEIKAATKRRMTIKYFTEDDIYVCDS